MSRLFFVAGERSGDDRGAELLQALRQREPAVQFFGRGGPKMRALAGVQLRDWIDQAGVVGLWEVLKHYFFFRREFAGTLREIASLKPDAVVLIDYPGFNLRLARALRKKQAAARIIYYISPQVWAWHQGRVSSMARSIDLMLCIFPFEPRFYESAGLRALFVGHPIASSQSLSWAQPEGERDPQLVALFPGSRHREVRKILPVMLRAARELLRTHPALRFEIVAASETLARGIERSIAGEKKFSVSGAEPHELMKRANAAMIASGTATLEAALAQLPFMLVYRVAWLTYFVARLVVKVRWLGMPNVLANREIVPEFIQGKARPAPIARAVARLLDDASARSAMLADLASVAGELRAGEASANAAEAILSELPHSTEARELESRKR